MAAPTTAHSVTARKLSSTIISLWAKIKSTFQTLGNLVTAWGSTPSDTKYPSEKLVKTSLDAKAPNAPSEVTIATGDKPLIADSSDGNKVKRASISFDTGVTTTYLCRNGAFDAVKEADVDWGGSFRTTKSPSEIFTSQNVWFGPRPSAVVVEYTTNRTAENPTWTDYGLTDDQKYQLFCGNESSNAGVYCGKNTHIQPGYTGTISGTKDLTDAMVPDQGLRITICCRNFSSRNADSDNWCCAGIVRVLMYLTTNSATRGRRHCVVETLSGGNFKASVDTWVNNGDFNVSGDGGWNSIPLQITYGGGWTQTSRPWAVRFTFWADGLSTSPAASQTGNLRVITIGALANIVWNASGLRAPMQRFGVPYSVDYKGKAIFGEIQFTARKLKTNLARTSDSTFDGSADQTNIPVTGTLPIANGGTGKTTAKAAQNALLSNMNSVNTDAPSDANLVFKYTSPTDTDGAIFTRPLSKIWTWIKGKLSSDSNVNISGNAATATAAAGYTSGGDIDTALGNKQDALGINSSTGDTTKYLNERGQWATPAGTAQVQSDWAQTDTSAVDYIKNKPSAVMWLTYGTSYTSEQISGWLTSGYLLCVSYSSKVYVYAKDSSYQGTYSYFFIDARDYAYLRVNIVSSTCTWSEGDNYPAYVKYLEGTVSSAHDTMTVSKDSSNQTVVSSGDGTTAAPVYIRPKGHTAADNQFVVHEDGSISLNKFHSRFGYIEHHYNVPNEKVIRFGFSRTVSNVSHRESCIRLQYARNHVSFEVRIAINISTSGTVEAIGATVTCGNSVSSVNVPKVYSYSNANWHWVFVAFSRGDANIDHYLNWEYSGENSDGLNVTLVEAVHSDASAVTLCFIPIGNVNVDSGSFSGIGSATRPVYVNSSGQVVACNIFYA